MHNFECFSKSKVTLQFAFRKRERVENTQQTSFQKDKDFATLLKMNQFETITKVEQDNQHSKGARAIYG